MGMAVDDRNRYNWMENSLQKINTKHISLSVAEEKLNNQILQEILENIISKMKKNNALFKSMYSRVFYGGSYYDGLRVGHPEEFDLDLLMILPKFAEPALTNSNVSGFVNVQFKALDKFLMQPEAHTYVKILNLVDDKHYLITSSVSSWMESIVMKALNEFPLRRNMREFVTRNGAFQGNVCKSGPALTLKLKGYINSKTINIDIDLVPCFVFMRDKWPQPPYRQPPGDGRNEFFIVPKKPSHPQGVVGHYWRLSFQEQERTIMNKLQTFKPALKFLKQLRDQANFKDIASYFIKTVFLWEIDTNRSLFGSKPLSFVFMTMLKRLQERIEQKNIPYFWNKDFNLLAGVNPITLANISNRLRRIIEEIERNAKDPVFDIAKYLGSPTSTDRNQTPELLNNGAATTESSKWWCTIQ